MTPKVDLGQSIGESFRAVLVRTGGVEACLIIALEFSLSRTHRQVSEEIRYMSAMASAPIDANAKNTPTSGRLYFLDLSRCILFATPDGSDLKTTSTKAGGCPMSSCSMSPLGRICVIPRGTMARSCGRISMLRT
jgi:hypothetical protein